MEARAVHAWIVAGLLAAVAGVYAQTLRFDFVGTDDPQYVTENEQVQKGLTVEGVRWAFTTLKASNWHPVTWLSLMLDAEIGGGRPGVFHGTNVLLHAANTLLLFWLLLSLTGNGLAAGLVAALFAVHPLQVEPVAWIAERKGVLSSFFWLLSTVAWVSWVRERGALRYAATLVLFALGLMTKPVLVTLPLTLLLLDLWPLRRIDPTRLASDLWKRIPEKLPLLALSAIQFMLTLRAQWGGVRGSRDWGLTLANVLHDYGWYLTKMVWPSGLGLLYNFPDPIPLAMLLASAAALLVFSWFAWRERVRHPYVLFGWLWYLGTLVPVIGFVQVGVQPFADRYMYVPSIGLFVVIVWGLGDLWSRWGWGGVPVRARVAASLGVLLLLGGLAHLQVRHWRDAGTLFSRMLDTGNGNPILAHSGLGKALADQGDTERAIEHYRRALALRPTAGFALRGLTRLLVERGETEAAIEVNARAVSANPRSRSAIRRLGKLLHDSGRPADAISVYQRALERAPDDGDARAGVARSLTALGRLDEAETELQRAEIDAPGSAQVHRARGGLALQRGDPAAAVAPLERAVELDPADVETRQRLASALMQLGQVDRADVVLTELLRRDPDHATAHFLSGLIRERQGRLDDARRHLNEAARLAPELGAAKQELERLQRFEQPDTLKGRPQSALPSGP